MADLSDLLLYLSTGRTIAWVGAGPSVEIGLPGWRKLAYAVLQECQTRPGRHLARITHLFEGRKYPEMFDAVAQAHGREFLVDAIRRCTQDPGTVGNAYKAISDLNFLAFFTTNFEQSLLRHLEASGHAFKPYLNSRDELQTVDVDTIPTLVHVHGRPDNPESLVASRGDYQRFYKAGDHQYFQDFIKSYLLRDRIVFIGYGLSDPDFNELQEHIATNFRRTVRSIAILANASQDDIDYWSRYYNIDVVSYETLQDDHSQLANILQSVARFMAIGKIAPKRVSQDDLRDTQALYMWERFRTREAELAIRDALSSVVVDIVSHSRQRVTVQEIADKLQRDLQIDVHDNAEILRATLDDLQVAGWIQEADGQYWMDSSRIEMTEITQRQFADLMAVFQRQLEIDISSSVGLRDTNAASLASVAVDTLLDVFELRGHEVLQSVFGNQPVNPTSTVDLVETIWGRANSISAVNLRFPFVDFILRMLTQPGEIHSRVLSYLARAFFSIQALRMDPDAANRIRRIVSARTVVIDANVLIPMTAKGEDRFEFSNLLLEAMKAANLTLCTTSTFLDEVRRHAQWALDRIFEFGAQSLEILYAARGEGGYESNAYLKGYISEELRGGSDDFIGYLRDCFGGSFQKDRFERFFKEIMGLHIISEEELDGLWDIRSEGYKTARDMMLEWNRSREELERKSDRRIDSEAQVFGLLDGWELFLSRLPDCASPSITYLTSGSSVAKIAQSTGVHHSMLVASPDALWRLIESLPVSGQRRPSYRSLMLTSYFRLASHFVDSERYRQFFQPLISKAKADFEWHRESLEEILGQGVEPSLLEKYAPEDWPGVMEDLQRIAEGRLKAARVGQEQLMEENLQLRELLAEYQERERKRRDFVRRQRRRQGRPR